MDWPNRYPTKTQLCHPPLGWMTLSTSFDNAKLSKLLANFIPCNPSFQLFHILFANKWHVRLRTCCKSHITYYLLQLKKYKILEAWRTETVFNMVLCCIGVYQLRQTLVTPYFDLKKVLKMHFFLFFLFFLKCIFFL